MDIEIVRQMQLSKVIGELNVLVSSYYDRIGKDKEKYQEVKECVDDIIDRLVDSI